MFHGIDPEHHAYRRRAHLAEIIALLGPPPENLLARSPLASTFFSNNGILSPCRSLLLHLDRTPC